jgi:hypothetical protein
MFRLESLIPPCMKAFTSQTASLAKALIGNRKTNWGLSPQISR